MSYHLTTPQSDPTGGPGGPHPVGTASHGPGPGKQISNIITALSNVKHTVAGPGYRSGRVRIRVRIVRHPGRKPRWAAAARLREGNIP